MSKDFYQIHALAERRAEILIYEQIGVDYWTDSGVGAKKFAEDLRALGDLDVIDVRLNSPGGNVFEGSAIYNVLRSHKARVDVYIDGIAASIASVIAMAGDTITMPENAMMMIHDPSGVAMGDAATMRKMAETLDKVKESLIAAYMRKTGMPREDIADLMTDETWMTAADAVAFGFADEMTEPVRVAARHNLSMFNRVPDNLAAKLCGAQGGYMPAPRAGLSNAGETGKEGDSQMSENKGASPDITRDFIANQHPAIAESLRNEGAKAAFDDGFKAGATAERERIAAVEAQLVPGCEVLIAELKADGKTSGPEAAVKVVQAMRDRGDAHLAALKQDAPQAMGHVEADNSGQSDSSLPVEERCKAEWDKSAKLRGEFSSVEAYVAFTKRAESGHAKILKH